MFKENRCTGRSLKLCYSRYLLSRVYCQILFHIFKVNIPHIDAGQNTSPIPLTWSKRRLSWGGHSNQKSKGLVSQQLRNLTKLQNLLSRTFFNQLGTKYPSVMWMKVCNFEGEMTTKQHKKSFLENAVCNFNKTSLY